MNRLGMLVNPEEELMSIAEAADALLPRAEQLLDAAYASRDRRKELLALSDLGVVYSRGGDVRRAIVSLEAALVVAHELRDQTAELDILDNLSMAALKAGQTERALTMLEQVVVTAREAGLRYQEKISLEHLGMALMAAKRYVEALSTISAALALARELRDSHHEADLLWLLAITHADLDQRENAIRRAEEAISLYRQQGSPYVSWLTEQMQHYRGGADTKLSRANFAPASSFPTSSLGAFSVTTSTVEPQNSPTTGGGPGLLRMALSAMKSVSRFFASGFQSVSQTAYQQRLETCESCEHHTGVRCSLCGCFCGIKAWMPHEDCPVGKWQP